MPAGNIKSNDYPISFLKGVNSISNLFYDSKRLVTQHLARFFNCPSLIHMKVASANATGSKPDNSICRMLYFRIFYLFYSNLIRPPINNCSYKITPIL